MDLSEAQDHYLSAVLIGDRRRAFAVVDAACDAGFGQRSLYLDVFQPALREVGRRWEENDLSVAQEHLATAITQSAMARLYDRLFEGAEDGPVLVGACVAGEQHEVGLQMLCDLAERAGWTSYFLGASVPAVDLRRLIEEKGARVVALSVSADRHLDALRDAVIEVRRAALDPLPLVVVGGRGLLGRSALAHELGADLTAEDAGAAVDALIARGS